MAIRRSSKREGPAIKAINKNYESVAEACPLLKNPHCHNYFQPTKEHIACQTVPLWL
jgi:hypothetical protein